MSALAADPEVVDRFGPDTYALTLALLQGHLKRRMACPESLDDYPRPAEIERFDELGRRFLRRLESSFAPAAIPAGPESFSSWHMALRKQAQLLSQPLFDHLARRASLEQIAFQVCIDARMQARLQDVIPLAQVGMEDDARLALAASYWDALGRGRREDDQARLLRETAAWFARTLERSRLALMSRSLPQPLAVQILHMLLALDRRHALRLLGALAFIRLTAPVALAQVAQGMRRLGVPAERIYYHEVHVRMDARHGDDLLQRVLQPLIARCPARLDEIAMGMLLQYQVQLDCHRAVANELDLP